MWYSIITARDTENESQQGYRVENEVDKVQKSLERIAQKLNEKNIWKGIDKSKIMCYTIITETKTIQTQRGKANPKQPWNFTENMNAKTKQTAV